ncbi:MAG: hypothetical protein RL701_1920, partial [Pseudomonadota bacterium]
WQQVEERLDTFGPAAQRTLPLRMGVIESVLFSWGTPWIRHVHAEKPETRIRLEFTSSTTTILTKLLRTGELDFVLAALPVGGNGIDT